MQKTAEERITASRVRLLLTKPFFGQLATRLKLQEFEMPTAATDGRHFYFNREFIDRLDDPELDFLVGHEVLHCVYDHMQARGDRQPVLYNVACDFNINIELVDQGIGKVIGEDKLNGGKPCLDYKYRGMNSYEIYDKLIEDGKQLMGMDVHFDDDSDGEGNGPGGEGNPCKGMSEEEKKALKDEIKQAVIQAAQGAGPDVPETIKRMVNELTAPKMDWRDVLRITLESSIKNDFTFMRPSRRSSNEVIFPGMDRDKQLDLVIALDMSGSIDDKTAKQMLSEVQGIMAQYNDYKITVMCFDTGVYNLDVFTSDDGRDITEYDLAGGGGTDFDVVYKFMEQEGIEPDQLVMFTDGYPWGSWGNADYCDTLFVIHGDPQKRITSPFGTTVHFDEAA